MGIQNEIESVPQWPNVVLPLKSFMTQSAFSPHASIITDNVLKHEARIFVKLSQSLWTHSYMCDVIVNKVRGMCLWSLGKNVQWEANQEERQLFWAYGWLNGCHPVWYLVLMIQCEQSWYEGDIIFDSFCLCLLWLAVCQFIQELNIQKNILQLQLKYDD